MKRHRQIYIYLLACLLIFSIQAVLSVTVHAAPGDLDPTFGNGGKMVGPGGYAVGATIPMDGKVIFGGGDGGFVARYNSDGSLDTAFGGGYGMVWLEAGGYVSCSDVVTQHDGKILALCYDHTVVGFNALFRLEPSGNLDPSFGLGGSLSFGYVDMSSIALQSDGKIVVAGPNAIRLNADGSPDTSFGGGDGVAHLLGPATDSVIQADGKIIVACRVGDQVSGVDVVVRLTAAGSVDPTFIQTPLSLGSVNSVALQADGKIVAAGSSDNGPNSDFVLVRLNSNGSRDTMFGTDGRVTTDFGSSGEAASSVALQIDGKILASGYSGKAPNPNFDFAIARYNPNGSLDSTFGGGDGMTTINFNNSSSDFGRGMAIDGRGRAIVGGESSGAVALAAVQLGIVAATITVTNTNDSGPGSLRQAIADAASGDVISFDAGVFSSPQTITLTSGQLVIDKNLTILGPGRSLLSISGNFNGFSGGTRVFYVDSGVTATFDGMTIRDGLTYAVGSDSGYGGGIANYGTLTVTNSTIYNNHSEDTSSAEFSNPGIGGGIANYGTMTVADSTVSWNTAGYYNASPGSYSSTSYGGGIFNVGTIVVTNCAISDNYSINNGGGIFNVGATFNVSNSTISRNSAGGVGGGVDNATGLTVTNSVISGNSAGGAGGGINNFGVLLITKANVSGNKAARGGGIFVEGDSTEYGLTLVLNSSTVSGNTGDGIFIQDSSVKVNNSTISTNSGDGIIMINSTVISETLTVTSSTVSSNTSRGIYCRSAGLIPANTIVGNNIGGDIDAASGFLGIASHNLIGDAGSSGGITNGVNGNIVGVNPLLGPLQDNGGPTLTHALLAGSRAINAGSNCVLTENGCGFQHPALPTDQRGSARVGAVDIGAFESSTPNRTRFDFDGDGRADISVFRPSDGTWYLRSTQGYSVTQFGTSTDRIAPADFDGDGKTDLAVFRPSTGTWYIAGSTAGFYTDGWGQIGDLPVPADYDGDGKADVAVYRPSNGTWYRKMSSSGISIVQFGTAEDKPVAADYDGDGKADLAVRRPSDNVWYFLRTAAGFTGIQWGAVGDIQAPADFDGDGKTDVAVFRPSTGVWFIAASTAGFMTQSWGANGDIPVPADYDGDGKADIAVYRPSNSTWYLSRSSAGILVNQFGTAEDKPVHSAFSY